MSTRIGILTGGGDCPGLNAVIRAVTKHAIHTYDWNVIGDAMNAAIARTYPNVAR